MFSATVSWAIDCKIAFKNAPETLMQACILLLRGISCP
jgi:hypothetical protein